MFCGMNLNSLENLVVEWTGECSPIAVQSLFSCDYPNLKRLRWMHLDGPKVTIAGFLRKLRACQDGQVSLEKLTITASKCVEPEVAHVISGFMDPLISLHTLELHLDFLPADEFIELLSRIAANVRTLIYSLHCGHANSIDFSDLLAILDPGDGELLFPLVTHLRGAFSCTYTLHGVEAHRELVLKLLKCRLEAGAVPMELIYFSANQYSTSFTAISPED
jgi:hypothetical protein